MNKLILITLLTLSTLATADEKIMLLVDDSGKSNGKLVLNENECSIDSEHYKRIYPYDGLATNANGEIEKVCWKLGETPPIESDTLPLVTLIEELEIDNQKVYLPHNIAQYYFQDIHTEQ